MKKPNHFATTTNAIGLTLLEYTNLKKFSCGISGIIFQYNFLKQNQAKKLGVHFTLMKDELSQIYKKEQIGMLFNKVNIPHIGVELSQLKFSKITAKKGIETTVINLPKEDNVTLAKRVISQLPLMIGRAVIVNFYSEIGESANLAASYVTEQLAKTYKAVTTNGIELNKLSVDFNNQTGLEELVSKDFLTIFALNSVFSTEHRASYMENLYTLAKLKKVPIITSSNSELRLPQFHVINLKLTDKQKTAHELVAEIFGTVDAPK